MKKGTPVFEEYRRALATNDGEFDNSRLNNLIDFFVGIMNEPGFEQCERIEEKCIDRLDADVKVPAIQGYCELPETVFE